MDRNGTTPADMNLDRNVTIPADMNLGGNGTTPTDMSENKNVAKEVRHYFTSAASTMIGIGVFMVLLSFIGFFGAFKESRRLLLCYAFVLMPIVLVQIAGIILLVIYQENMNTRISTFLESTLDYYGRSSHVTKYWDNKFERFDCCGGNGDFNDNTSMILPDVCAIKEMRNIKPDEKAAINGCLEKVFGSMKDDILYAIIITAVVIVIEILAIAFALGLNISGLA